MKTRTNPFEQAIEDEIESRRHDIWIRAAGCWTTRDCWCTVDQSEQDRHTEFNSPWIDEEGNRVTV